MTKFKAENFHGVVLEGVIPGEYDLDDVIQVIVDGENFFINGWEWRIEILD